MNHMNHVKFKGEILEIRYNYMKIHTLTSGKVDVCIFRILHREYEWANSIELESIIQILDDLNLLDDMIKTINDLIGAKGSQ